MRRPVPGRNSDFRMGMGMAQEEYKVRLEVFEGPLDLLLYLIKKEELDIHNIPIERVTA